jgi:hypothetical protein
MTTDTQLIRRIRAALDARADELAPVPDMLQRVRALPARELPSGRRSRRRVGGAVAAVVSTAVVVVVVIVIGAIGHTDHGSAPGSAASIPEKGLISRLAVLRRPQHPSDRLPAAGAALLQRLHVSFDPKLTRLAVSMTPEPHGTTRLDVYLIVTGGVGRRAGYSFASVRTVVVAVSRHGRFQLSSSGLSAPGAAAFAQDVSAPMGLGGQSGIRVGIVPDGVARVRWVLTQFPTSTASPVTVYPRVQNNVAIATGVSGNQLVSATWYGPDERVISSFSDRARIDREEAAQARLIDRSAHEPIARELVEHFSVFGQPPPRSAPIKPLPAFARADIAAYPQQLNLDQARFVQYPGMPGFWLVPGRLGVAIATSSSPPGLSTDGAPLNRVLDGRMIASVGSAPPRETVYGLVPDGNPTVAIKLADRTTKTVRVIDNLYAVTLTQRPTTLTAKNAAGQTVSVRVPG